MEKWHIRNQINQWFCLTELRFFLQHPDSYIPFSCILATSLVWSLQFIYWDLCIYSLLGKGRHCAFLPHLLEFSEGLGGPVYEGSLVDTITWLSKDFWQSPSWNEKWVSPIFFFYNAKRDQLLPRVTQHKDQFSDLTLCEMFHTLLTTEDPKEIHLSWTTPAFRAAPFISMLGL